MLCVCKCNWKDFRTLWCSSIWGRVFEGSADDMILSGAGHKLVSSFKFPEAHYMYLNNERLS